MELAVKQSFQHIAICCFSLLILGCSMTIPSTRGREKEYAKFCTEICNDKKSLIKGKTLHEVDPSFWKQSGNIPVTVYKGEIIAVGIGKIDKFETAKGIVLGGIVGGILTGPQRGEDPFLQQNIEKFTEFYNWQTDDYFFELLKQATALPIARKTSDEFILDRFGQPMAQTEEIGARNIIITPIFMIIPNKMGGWNEPRYRLMANLGVTVVTDEALRGFKARFHEMQLPLIASFMWTDKKESGMELRRINAFPGMYMIGIYKNSPYYTKEQWLSENGAFLEKELKSNLAFLAQEVNRMCFPLESFSLPTSSAHKGY